VNLSATAGWDNFFVAQASAAAALAGLLFVAVSINLGRILSLRHLPGRAAETLVLVLLQLAVAMLGLVPGQPVELLGGEFALLGMSAMALATFLQWRAREDPHRHVAVRLFTNQLPEALVLIGGLQLLARCPAGVYWIAPAAVLGFLGFSTNVWVLLIEIQR
jgi:hypothetical protein